MLRTRVNDKTVCRVKELPDPDSEILYFCYLH